MSANDTTTAETREVFGGENTLQFVLIALVFAWQVIQAYEWFKERFGGATDAVEEISTHIRREAFQRIEEIHQYVGDRRKRPSLLSRDEAKQLSDVHAWLSKEDESGRRLIYSGYSVKQGIQEIKHELQNQSRSPSHPRGYYHHGYQHRPRRNSTPPEEYTPPPEKELPV